MSEKVMSTSEMARMASELDAMAPLTADAPAPHEHLDVLDNVLRDTPTKPETRRWLLKRAATGAAVAGAAGLMDPVGTAFAATARTASDSIKTVGVTAVTAEAFAVTFLTATLERPPSDTPKNVADVVRAADVEEFFHYEFLRKAGFKPLTTNFYFPKALFPDHVKDVAAIIEIAETLFINAYLIGTSVFAKAGNPTLARYAAEILGVEAEHRALARFVQGKLPNNVAFEGYKYHKLSDIVKQLEDAGVGFGKPTKKGGSKYRFHGVGNIGAGLHISNHKPS